MAGHMQCAWVYSMVQAPWAAGWLARQRSGELSRFALLECPLGGDAGPEPPVMPIEHLGHVRSRLLCTQVCLLAVGARNLAWMRTALSAAGGWPVPVVVVAHALRAEAIDDLMRLGVHDFICAQASVDELRARCAIAARRRNLFLSSSPALPRPLSGAPCHALEPASAYPPAGAANETGQTASRAGRDGLPSELFLHRTFGCSSDEGFGVAKARVVAGFERAYLHAALQRHRGNVARAARACDKHRRAFWGLVNKHGMDLAAYRQGAVGTPHPALLDGPGRQTVKWPVTPPP